MERYSDIDVTALFDPEDLSIPDEVQWSKTGNRWQREVEVGGQDYLIILTLEEESHPTKRENIPYVDVSFRALGLSHPYEDLSESRPLSDVVSLFTVVIGTSLAFFHQNKWSEDISLYANRFYFHAFLEDVYKEKSPRANIYEKMIHRLVPRVFPSWYYSVEKGSSDWMFEVWSPLYAHTFNYWE